MGGGGGVDRSRRATGRWRRRRRAPRRGRCRRLVRELHREGELPRGDPHPCVRETSREGTAEDLVFVLRGGEDDVRDVAADGGEELEALLRGGDGVVDPQTTVAHANHRPLRTLVLTPRFRPMPCSCSNTHTRSGTSSRDTVARERSGVSGNGNPVTLTYRRLASSASSSDDPEDDVEDARERSFGRYRPPPAPRTRARGAIVAGALKARIAPPHVSARRPEWTPTRTPAPSSSPPTRRASSVSCS